MIKSENTNNHQRISKTNSDNKSTSRITQDSIQIIKGELKMIKKETIRKQIKRQNEKERLKFALLTGMRY